MIVGLVNGVLGREPKVLACVERVVEARSRKAADRAVEIVNALNDTVRALEVVNKRAGLFAVLVGDDYLGFAALRRFQLGVLVDIAVSVTRDGYRLCPCRDIRRDTVHENGLAEHRAVQNGSDSAVRRLPHLFQLVLLHALSVGGDGRALYRNAVLLCGVRAVDRDLIVRLIAVNQTEVIVLAFQVDIRIDQDILDHLPYNARHFVAVHLYKRRCHLYFCHNYILSESVYLRSSFRMCIIFIVIGSFKTVFEKLF